MTVRAEPGEKLEHLLDLPDVGLLVNRRVGGDLVAEDLGHPDRLNAFLEDAFALDNEVVRVLESVDVHVPIHPGGRSNHGLGLGRAGPLPPAGAVADGLGVPVGKQFFIEQFFEGRLKVRREDGRQVVLHLFAHEHAVGADIDDAALRQQPGHQLLDLRINKRFAAANGDHGRVAFAR